MKDNRFNTQGYAVVKGKDTESPQFLSRSPSTPSSSSGSGSAIGSGGTHWTNQPDVESLFSDQKVAQQLAQEQGGEIVQCSVELELSGIRQTA